LPWYQRRIVPTSLISHMPIASGTSMASTTCELAAWSAHRTRRVETRTATKNQLLGQLDRSFPGLTLALQDEEREVVSVVSG